MKVLFISAGDYKYGAPKSMFELMIHLKANYGVIPVLLTKKHNPMNEECDKLGIENYSFWSRDIMSGSSYQNPLLNIIKQCVKYCLYIWGGMTQHGIKKTGIDFSEIDIIHTNLNRNDIGAYISREYHIPHVWHLREHGREDYRVSIYKPHISAYMNQNTHYFIAISNAVRNTWINRGLCKDKIKVIYNGLSDADFIPKKARNDGLIKIVMTGHIQPTKGQMQLIQAVGACSPDIKNRIRVDFYGEAYNDYGSSLKKEVERLQIQDIVQFCGYCSNVPAMLSEYDVGVVCSKAEGFGRITVEYMLAGLLVIASDTGANPELIQDNESGMLYPYNNISQLAEKIECVVKVPELLKAYGEKARNDALMKFSVEHYTNEVYSVYQQVMADKTHT